MQPPRRKSGPLYVVLCTFFSLGHQGSALPVVQFMIVISHILSTSNHLFRLLGSELLHNDQKHESLFIMI